MRSSWTVTSLLPFLSTPSARRATDCHDQLSGRSENFYPRPPRGGRPIWNQLLDQQDRFLSTPSARRATFDGGYHLYAKEFLSTPSARRATQIIVEVMQWQKKFLSTPSARRATCGRGYSTQAQIISIHALREEGDRSSIRSRH